MKTYFSLKTLAATACAAVLALGASGAAQAHGDNIYWSIGMSSPGVQVGVASAPPMVMYPPVYVAPRPVVYGPPGWGHQRHHGWHNGYGHREYERHGHDGRFEHGRQGGYEQHRGGGHPGHGDGRRH